MNTKTTGEPKDTGHYKVPAGVVAGDIGLDHEAGDQAQHPIKQTMGKLFGRVQRATRKKS